jgi:hypothetical protein
VGLKRLVCMYPLVYALNLVCTPNLVCTHRLVCALSVYLLRDDGFRYYSDLVRNLINARNVSFPLILRLRLVSKLIRTLREINIIGFRVNIAVVDITIIK